MRGRSIAVALVAASLWVGAFARADGLSPSETDRLLRGSTVARTQAFEREGRRYVGGVAYAIVDAQAWELAALLDDVGGWRQFLPKTRDARHVGTQAGDTFVEVTHGSAIVHVNYTLRVHREANVVRFWMDPSRPHDIEDAWGFFRSDPLEGGRTLVTYGILIDMGDGLLRTLFEDRVRGLALTVPDRVRGLLLE
ncbi:MAG TPA: hypothetical protein VN894_17280, partial [Polyangiaceae bacterium]|nr:hypothetical protein [Polyangiaceae bacterium]